MPTTSTATWLALSSRVDSLPGGFAVFGPDEAFDPPSDQYGPLPYVLLSDSRNAPERFGLSGGVSGGVAHRESGTLLIALHYPIARGISYTQLQEMIGKFVDHFPADEKMRYGTTCLRVERTPDQVTPYRDGTNRVFAVRVLWTTV
jgi:hypothetical protein|tara:strand:+ start:29657 stop:30094 length:438 start_codon:yes stop_codon:yes gene_type:complete